MFMKLDKDKRGKLSYQDFRNSFKLLDYGLADNDINMLIALADEDDEEMIDWK
jgi:Ca2+-binding EF-hand superfamily protein